MVATREPKEGQSFFPLSVDYQEKFASAGRIPGSFFKREARLNDYEILTSRLIDRALRPLFPEDYLCEVQVLVTLVSSDFEVMPDALACLAASAALAVSDIPIKEIISEARIGRLNGQLIVNPSRTELETTDMEFIIAATDKNLMMVEGKAAECGEEDLVVGSLADRARRHPYPDQGAGRTSQQGRSNCKKRLQETRTERRDHAEGECLRQG